MYVVPRDASHCQRSSFFVCGGVVQSFLFSSGCVSVVCYVNAVSRMANAQADEQCIRNVLLCNATATHYSRIY